MPKSMTHLNHHLLCATDCETTGVKPGWHEIIQISFIPLDERIEINKNLPMFDLLIKPEHPERIEPNTPGQDTIKRAIETGHDKWIAVELFEHWFDSLQLAEKKRIVPLAHNYYFDRSFYMEWMGYESYNHFIDSRCRDLFVVANFLNDYAEFNAMDYPFPNNLRLKTVAKKLGVDVDDSRLHDSLYDSWIATQAYKKAVTIFFSGVI